MTATSKKYSLRANNIIIYIFLISLIPNFSRGQTQGELNLPQPKRLIDKVEVFVAPSLSFNHGNKFIENYKDENITNTRLLKPGYVLGIGGYHSLSNRLDLNIRLLYEQKGTKNELNTPSLPDGRIISLDNYSYNYLTIIAAPQITIDRKMNFVISAGVYYSRIKEIKGTTKLSDTNGIVNSEGSFNGRYFYDLSDDGIRQGFAWMPNLSSIEKYDIGVVVSVGYKIPLKEKHIIVVQLQDNFGIQSINKNNPYGLREKNHSITLIINYIFKLPSKK